MELHRAAALTAIVAVVAVNIGNANPLDREEGNASISIEHYHQEPRSGTCLPAFSEIAGMIKKCHFKRELLTVSLYPNIFIV